MGGNWEFKITFLAEGEVAALRFDGGRDRAGGRLKCVGLVSQQRRRRRSTATILRDGRRGRRQRAGGKERVARVRNFGVAATAAATDNFIQRLRISLAGRDSSSSSDDNVRRWALIFRKMERRPGVLLVFLHEKNIMNESKGAAYRKRQKWKKATLREAQ